ncbi:MAG: hypothetical protein ABIF71_04305 [Planctomycetota bacterium]
MTSPTDKAQIVISRKAAPLHLVTREIADNLTGIDVIRLVKVTPGFLQASSEVSGPRRIPITKPGHPSAIGISLIVEEDREEVQFYEITSAVKGYGSRMVEAVLRAMPKKWKAVVVMDWSDGFWKAMRRRHRRIVLM